MKKENRLKKNEDFKKVISKHYCFSNEEFVVYFDSNKNEKIRIGISVSKKIGNSVVRHKCKRQVNEMIRKICDKNFGYDIIIIVKSKFLMNDFQKNYLDLESLYKKILKENEGKYE